VTHFIDASVLVSVIARESDHETQKSRMEQATEPLTSGVAIWEAARAVARRANTDVMIGFDEVQRYCGAFGITVVPIGAQEAMEALRAQARYGKGSGHPARLNMGDCFAYACARTNGARLLYKGDDFSRTDMA
jgi:ribonuclease VapC